jgi:hypothetical protein
MFEFLMLIGFLGAGLCHWQPSREKKESEGSEKRSGAERGGKAVKVKEEELPRETMRARIAAA